MFDWFARQWEASLPWQKWFICILIPVDALLVTSAVLAFTAPNLFDFTEPSASPPSAGNHTEQIGTPLPSPTVSLSKAPGGQPRRTGAPSSSPSATPSAPATSPPTASPTPSVAPATTEPPSPTQGPTDPPGDDPPPGGGGNDGGGVIDLPIDPPLGDIIP